MLARISSAAVMGVQSYPIVVEVDCAEGLPGFSMVGLPDSAVKEARDRVFSSIRNKGFRIPNRKMTINLSPADIPKAGSAYDLPIALGLLMASEQIETFDVSDSLFIGELSLDGLVQPIRGSLPIVLEAHRLGFKKVYIPRKNYAEVRNVVDISVFPISDLSELLQILEGKQAPLSAFGKKEEQKTPSYLDTEFIPFTDFSEVQGQEGGKRACEIAAAGGHHFLFIGSPGCGKSMLARALPGILPEMSHSECLSSSIIHSVSGNLRAGEGLLKHRPFRSPHHSISGSALIGGGQIPRPGEISLAHNGFLFLDELGEFKRDVLESLRQPLESKMVTIARSRMALDFPCEFLLGAAMNPCPCGYLLDPNRKCTCSPRDIKRYLSKVSGPLLDRMDLQVEMMPVESQSLGNELLKSKNFQKQESSQEVRHRVGQAWEIQRQRFLKRNFSLNARMTSRDIKEFCLLSSEVKSFLDRCIESISLSARAYYQVIRVARTIADLEGVEEIQEHHLAEALQYRGLDRTSLYLSGMGS